MKQLYIQWSLSMNFLRSIVRFWNVEPTKWYSIIALSLRMNHIEMVGGPMKKKYKLRRNGLINSKYPFYMLSPFCALSFWALPPLGVPVLWDPKELECSRALSFKLLTTCMSITGELVRITRSQTPSQTERFRIFILTRFSGGSYAHKMLRTTTFV